MSDAFDVPAETDKFEWTATLININPGMNPELLARCEALGDYTTFVEKVKTYSRVMPLVNAVDRAVDECVESGVLEYFLNKHRKEVKNMVLTEFDEEKYLKMMREEERAIGRAEERLDNFLSILSDLGEVPEAVATRVQGLDKETMKRWIKIAARAESMEEFLQNIDEG